MTEAARNEIHAYLLKNIDCLSRDGKISRETFDGLNAISTHLAVDNFTKILDDRFTITYKPKTSIEDLIHQSSKDRSAWIACEKLLYQAMRSEKAVPESLILWLKNRATIPAIKGKNPRDNLLRNKTIACSVYKATKHGMQAYTNDESYQNSACALVSEVCAELKIQLSLSAVIKIWTNYSRHIPRE